RTAASRGLRWGGLLARPELARPILRYNTNDLGVNVLAQVATIAALRTKKMWIESIRATTRENAARIREVAESVDGVRVPVFPSEANMFVLDIHATGLTPEAVQEDLLLRHGVFVRAGNYLSPKFGHRFVRVSFSNPPSDVDRFV
ncbi:aspartate aminotransferase, partial [mine drainage metagenome]